ncbi:hypothetical protein [Nocardioides pelophilus]|uniref:hypothetical protein n=1 Tax=Nocardioides pelophilus TaxID=2172019 RepID=UPI001603F369|nr:hypothetical protein [Nocardioides pelophilus]
MKNPHPAPTALLPSRTDATNDAADAARDPGHAAEHRTTVSAHRPDGAQESQSSRYVPGNYLG